MKNIILGVTGSIAAYKAAEIAHLLFKKGFQVEVIMTNGATKFVTPLTFRTLTQNRVHTDVFQDDFPNEVKHISLAQKADAVLIAPATANIIGKIAGGIGDDMHFRIIRRKHNDEIADIRKLFLGSNLLYFVMLAPLLCGHSVRSVYLRPCGLIY